MTFPSIVALAVGLAMDATAVAAARGVVVPAVRWSHVLRVALFFGGFQALMPAVGWFLGARIGPAVEQWDHWIAFVLLALIGGKMLLEARGGDGAEVRTLDRPFAWRTMLLLGAATSIDALAVGTTLPMLGAPLALSLATIGVVTALLSSLGLFAGRWFGAAIGKRFDAVGGLVLIALGAKVLVDHLG